MKIQVLAISLHVSAEQSKNLCISRSVSDRVDTSYIYKKRVLQPRLDGEGINPLKCRDLYTRHFLLFLSVWD